MGKDELKGIHALLELAKTEGFIITPNSDTYKSRGVRVNGLCIGQFKDCTLEYLKRFFAEKSANVSKTRAELIDSGYNCTGSTHEGFHVNGVYIKSDSMVSLSAKRIILNVEKVIGENLQNLQDSLTFLRHHFELEGNIHLVDSMLEATEELARKGRL